MATSITFNTLQRRELFSLYFCKCYATPLRNSHSSHLLITFPSPKHALTPKVSSFFNVKPPVITVINPGFSGLNCNFSAKSVEFRDYSENSGSGHSLFHSNYGKKDGILKDKNGRKLVDSVKSRKSGESVYLWKRNEKGDVNSSESDESLGFNSGRKWDNNNGGGSSSSSSRGEFGPRDNGRIDFGERIERGKDVSSSSDKRLGFDNRRIWVNKNGDGGWSREVGSENNGKIGGRGDYRKGGRGHGVLLSKSSGGKERGRMEGISGGVAIDDGNRGQKGYGVSSRRRIEGNQSARIGLNGNVHGENIKENNSSDNGKVKKKEKVSKKNKVGAPEFQLRIGLDMCSKKGDVMGAISLYDRAVKEGVKIGQHQYTVLLYLCSSAAMGVIRPAKSGSGRRSLNKVASHDLDGPEDSEEEEEEEEGEDDDYTESLDDEGLSVNDETENLVNEIKVSDDVKKYALERGFEVYERMCLEKVEVNEAALTSVARMAMAMGNGDMAFDMVKQMQSIGICPKLRSYSPAISVFSRSGELDKAFAVEKHMLENGVYPEEPELEALLRVSVQSGKADKVYYILHKLRTSVRSVSPSTAELIEKWFRSRESSRVGKRKWDVDLLAQTMENVGGGWHGQGWLGSGKWSVARTSVGANGLCKCCGEKLAVIDLDPEETEKFAESVASIAIKRDRNSSFQKFQRWLDYYGPFEAVVDAANVGLFSQRTFKPSKVNAVVNGIRQLLPSKKWPLIILHNKRVAGSKMEQPVNRALVDRWRNADALYPTPTGSNDDWYWLYAAIKFKCLLVTNDEMRDHTFQLLGNDFFPKWKERHQVRFRFTEIGPVFHMPPPCSVVIQESDRGFWHIPIASEHQSVGERIWLCISRPKTLVTQKDPSIMCLSNSRLRLLHSQAT